MLIFQHYFCEILTLVTSVSERLINRLVVRQGSTVKFNTLLC